MFIKSLIGSIEAHAVSSADAEAEFRGDVEALMAFPAIAEKMKKIRMWSAISFGVILISIWSDVGFTAVQISKALLGTILASLIFVTAFIWTTAKLKGIRGLNLMLRARVATSPESQEMFDRMRQQDIQQVIIQRVGQSENTLDSAGIAEIERLRNKLAYSHAEAARFEAEGNTSAVSRHRANAARAESELRSLGA